MTNYNNMTVPELMDLAFGSHYRYADCQLGYDDWCDAITSALRKAVIREASVGEIIIEQHEGYMSPDPLFTVGSDSKLKAGTFYIVPKETL